MVKIPGLPHALPITTDQPRLMAPATTQHARLAPEGSAGILRGLGQAQHHSVHLR